MIEPTKPGGKSLRPHHVLTVGLAMLLVGVVTFGIAAGSSPGAGPEVSTRPSLPQLTPHVEVSYDAVFDGDPTGASDVTAELVDFLQSHDGEHVALAPDGIYAVTTVAFSADDLTVDFRGAQLRGTEQGAYGILKIRSSSNVIINDAYVVGTGYEWDGGEGNPDQWEHGIEIDGGTAITLNHPTTRDTRGDGIYIGFESGVTVPPTGVVINDPDIERSARNGIAPVAGEVSIVGGHIYESGLHGVDFEPNNDEGAQSIVGVVDGVDIRRFSDLDVAGLTGYAVAAYGFSQAPKPSIIVQNVTGDVLRMLIPDTTVVTVRNNVSDAEAVADFEGSTTVIFTDNIRITRR